MATHLVEDGALGSGHPDPVADPHLPLRQSFMGDDDLVVPADPAPRPHCELDRSSYLPVAAEPVEEGGTSDAAAGPALLCRPPTPPPVASAS